VAAGLAAVAAGLAAVAAGLAAVAAGFLSPAGALVVAAPPAAGFLSSFFSAVSSVIAYVFVTIPAAMVLPPSLNANLCPYFYIFIIKIN
jgi:hypothetical protein